MAAVRSQLKPSNPQNGQNMERPEAMQPGRQSKTGGGCIPEPHCWSRRDQQGAANLNEMRQDEVSLVLL
jgi:hypothetical protein